MASILRVFFNVRVGQPDTAQDAPTHVRGVHEGNAEGNLEKEKGIIQRGRGARATAERSTGINAEARNPIDPRMPNLPPS